MQLYHLYCVAFLAKISRWPIFLQLGIILCSIATPLVEPPHAKNRKREPTPHRQCWYAVMTQRRPRILLLILTSLLDLVVCDHFSCDSWLKVYRHMRTHMRMSCNAPAHHVCVCASFDQKFGQRDVFVKISSTIKMMGLGTCAYIIAHVVTYPVGIWKIIMDVPRSFCNALRFGFFSSWRRRLIHTILLHARPC